MSRFLVLAALAACATTPARAPVADHRVSFDAWVQRWTDARACVVAPAQDLATGVAIAIQQGRDCSRLLARLVVEIAFDMEIQQNTMPLVLELTRRLARERFSPSKRTELVEGVDSILQGLEDARSVPR